MKDDRTTKVLNSDINISENIDDRTTNVLNTKNNNITHISEEDRSTSIVSDHKSTDNLLADENRSTNILNDDINHFTNITAENIQKDDNDKPVLSEIYPGIVIDGYSVGEKLNVQSGESDIRFCIKDNKTYIMKVYKHFINVDFSIYDKLKELNSNNILIPIKFGNYQGNNYEIQEYYNEGTLFDNIEKITVKQLKEVVVPQLNEVLNSMHTNNLIHNDIKPHNIYLADNGKRIVLGDFGITHDTFGRDYSTNISNATTIMYAAPGASNLVTFENDYYSFGMTIYHIARGFDPFKGIDNKEISKIRLRNKHEINKDLDKDLRDLIIMLTIYDPIDRINYEGVTSWLKDNKVFEYTSLKYERVKDDYSVDNFVVLVNGKEVIFNSLIKVTEVLNENWSIGITHFKNNTLATSVQKINQELHIKLNEIFRWGMETKKYDLGLFMSIQIINESLDAIYMGTEFNSLKNVIDFFDSNFKEFNVELFFILLFKPGLFNDKKSFLNLLDIFKTFVDFPETIYVTLQNRALDNGDNDNKFTNLFNKYIKELSNLNFLKRKKVDYNGLLKAIFMNSFSDHDKIYTSNNKYDTLEDYVLSLFDGFEIKNDELEAFSDLLYEILKVKFNIDEEIVNEIKQTEDKYTRFLKLSRLIVGKQVLLIGSSDVTDIKSFIDIFNKNYEKKKSNKYFIDFIKKNYFEKMASLEDLDVYKILQLDIEDINFEGEFYYLTNKNAKYLNFQNVKDLVNNLGKDPNYIKIITNIMNDKLFKSWLRGKGYDV